MSAIARVAFGSSSPTLAAAVAVVALTALGFALYENALSIPPFDADNLVVLSTAERAASAPWDLFKESFVSYIPGYRPAAYLTVWLQYQVSGVEPAAYFVVNILLWVGCAAAVYLLAVRIAGGAPAAALLAAVALLVDERGRAAIYWIGERQVTLACVLGAMALLLVLARKSEERGPWTEGAVFALLLGAFLSKEYGLAFAVAMLTVAVLGWPRIDRRLVLITFGAVAIYGLMRLILAGGASPPYCEQMGFFGERRTEVCYDEVGTGFRLTQHLYNIGATLVGTLFPALFEDDGVLRGVTDLPTVSLSQFLEEFALSAIVGIAAIVAWVRHTRTTLPLLALVLANAALGFMLYRDRSPVVGVVAVYASAGVTFADLIVAARVSRARSIATAAVAVVVLVLVVRSAKLAGDPIDTFRTETAATDPCVAYAAYREEIAPTLLERVKLENGLADIDCEPTTSK